jgi:hypothetical protein
MKLLLERIDDDKKQTIGAIFVLTDKNEILYVCHSLELPWRHNQKRISCIPTGKYKVIKHRSRKFGASFWVLNVPYRTEILIHKGNYNKDTLGCILPGEELKDINRDGIIDVASSTSALNTLLDMLPKKFELEIINGQGLTYDQLE